MKDSPAKNKSPAANLKLLIADDDPIVRAVLRERIRQDGRFTICGEATNGKEAVEMTAKLRPDLLLLDLAMPRQSGLDALRSISAWHVALRTIVLASSIERQQIVESLQLGARGLVLKDRLEELSLCFSTILSGKYWITGDCVENVVPYLQDLIAADTSLGNGRSYGLTQRERQVALMVAQGLANREIALKLSIAQDTVKRHLTNIFDKVGMSSRLELALFALEHKL